MDQRIISARSFLIPVIPSVILAVVILGRQLIVLDYMHVLLGGTWTGIDLFMGLVVGRILSRMDDEARVQFIMHLVPVMLFLMPTLAAVTITAGIYLAIYYGIFVITYVSIIAAGIIVAVLLIQGLGIFLPNEVRIYLELGKVKPDYPKISRLAFINFKLSGIQALFQFAIIFVMANIALGNYNLWI